MTPLPTPETSAFNSMDPMRYSQARRYADKIVEWLGPFCRHRLQIVGSIRRQRPLCGDVDIVALARVDEARDLLGAVTETRNYLLEELQAYVAKNAAHGVGWLAGSDGGVNLFVKLRNCELNMFVARPDTLTAVCLTRTGSKEHNIWLSKRARRLGYEWKAGGGLAHRAGLGLSAFLPVDNEDLVAGERQIYAELGLPWIDPVLREIGYLEKTYGRE